MSRPRWKTNREVSALALTEPCESKKVMKRLYQAQGACLRTEGLVQLVDHVEVSGVHKTDWLSAIHRLRMSDMEAFLTSS